MNGNVIGEPFDSFVLKQIKDRQSIQGKKKNRTIEDLNYLNNRNAWIKLASGVSIEDEKRLISLGISDTSKYLKTNLAKKCVLFNGLSELNGESLKGRAGLNLKNEIFNSKSAYGIGDIEKYGFQPMPGIVKVSIDCLNRGSIRQATVLIKAHNEFQFHLIELLYLKLGFTMLLEWGWDKYIDGEKYKNVRSTLIEEEFFHESNTTQLEMLKKIEKKRYEYKGNYDAFFGKVKNFEWNLANDGSYDITLDLITVGDIIESLTIQALTTNFKEIDTSTENIRYPFAIPTDSAIYKTLDSNPILNVVYEHIKKFNTKEAFFNEDSKNENKYKSQQTKKENFSDENKNLYFVGTSMLPTTTEEENKNILKNENKYRYFIKLKYLFDLIEKAIPIIDGEPSLIINKESANYFISLDRDIVPLDPTVCYYFEDFIGEYNKEQVGVFMNLYMNVEFIAQLFLKNTNNNREVKIFKFFQNLCDGINNAFANLIKLETILVNDKIITIIDQTLTKKSLLDGSENSFNMFGYEGSTSNFVKSFNFKTKITPQLATQISIGATAGGDSSSLIEGTAFSKWNIGLKDRFCKEIKHETLTIILEPPSKFIEEAKNENEERKRLEDYWDNNREIIKGSKSIKITNSSGEETSIRVATVTHNIVYNGVIEEYLSESIFSASEESYKTSFVNKHLEEWKKNQEKKKKQEEEDLKTFASQTNYRKFIKLYYKDISDHLEFNEYKIKKVKELYRKFILKKEKLSFDKMGNTPSTSGFIPLTLSLTIEGISGVKLYQKLVLNQKILPPNYPESFNFLITKVNHNIENNNWDTVLETLSTANVNGNEELLIESGYDGREIDTIVDDKQIVGIHIGSYTTKALTDTQLNEWLEKNIHKDVRNNFKNLLEKYNIEGIGVVITSGLRDKTKQKKLNNTNYNIPSIDPDKDISYHQIGYAIDINLYFSDTTGRFYEINSKSSKENWLKYGLIAPILEKTNLKWGGHFSDYDPVHFYKLDSEVKKKYKKVFINYIDRDNYENKGYKVYRWDEAQNNRVLLDNNVNNLINSKIKIINSFYYPNNS